MYTTLTSHRPYAVLMLDQRLRRWPNSKPASDECAVFVGKALFVNMSGDQLFAASHHNTIICVSTQCPSESIGEIIHWEMWLKYICTSYDLWTWS